MFVTRRNYIGFQKRREAKCIRLQDSRARLTAFLISSFDGSTGIDGIAKQSPQPFSPALRCSGAGVRLRVERAHCGFRSGPRQ